ncbi:MAG: DUF3007 family protein [Leptolyngbya sp. RL_3_1]|nr:DUF3007 family protein [Leptolyngbya sp. RL_3_1]
MRRIDVIGIGFGVFAVGGLLYLGLRVLGLDSPAAGIWSQVFFVGGILGWVGTYLTRVMNHDMTYNRQLEDYEEAVLQKRLDELTPEQLAQLQTALEADTGATDSESPEQPTSP